MDDLDLFWCSKTHINICMAEGPFYHNTWNVKSVMGLVRGMTLAGCLPLVVQTAAKLLFPRLPVSEIARNPYLQH
jgi:hypothetical protein